MKKIKEIIKHIEDNYWNSEHADNCKICLCHTNGSFLDGLRLSITLIKNK